jgi:hypothetical protein
MRKRWLGCALLLGVVSGGDYVARAADPRPPCCFTNPQYSGVCKVEPGEGETCASILEYLNKPQSMGKSYCENTTVRGGWAQEKCKEKAPGD